ncbi:uncharacterized protein LOC132306744 isoform X2 [Cornus florida]|uniref:uncharacterized protein LOC132306744 isoform X2 n=1 Tax=Cornus florida TaxID=4283 RepID=UPI00289F03A1|nr:uncharacterized protein LOC132306744 isoform X2 [Cornus florida]
MSAVAALTHGPSLRPSLPTTLFFNRPNLKHSSCFSARRRVLFSEEAKLVNVTRFFKSSSSRSSQHEDAESYEAAGSGVAREGQDQVVGEVLKNHESKTAGKEGSFLAKLAIALGIAATVTLVSVSLKQPAHGSSLGIQLLADGSSSSTLAASSSGFTFKAFGYKVVLPAYAPGWIYFWLLMAAGCGLFISEEALNIWVGISLARLLSLDGTWKSFVASFSSNGPYIISTVLWVYWGVCISDMVPFYLGKLFRQSGASDDVCSKLGIGKEKALSITRIVQRYGNLAGFVERFSFGVRNPTAFLAGVMDISPDCFFAGVCCGGLLTLPLQLGIGFLLRERPVFALATVATVVGVWTVFPYAVAASTALFLYLRRRYSS